LSRSDRGTVLAGRRRHGLREITASIGPLCLID
jgi:hypothetical protein